MGLKQKVFEKTEIFKEDLKELTEVAWRDRNRVDDDEVLLYETIGLLGTGAQDVHRNRGLIRDGSPGRPARFSHSSWALIETGSWLK